MLMNNYAIKAALAATVFSLSAAVMAAPVNGYIKKDGTYVAPHQRSAPDEYKFNNNNSKSNGGTQSDEFNPPKEKSTKRK